MKLAVGGMRFTTNFSSMSISRFGFLLTFLAYIALLFAEYLRPGFVSSAMNAHMLWVVMTGWIFAEVFTERVSYPAVEQTAKNSSALVRFLLVVTGIILGLIAWHIGAVFADLRLFFALAVGILPFVFL